MLGRIAEGRGVPASEAPPDSMSLFSHDFVGRWFKQSFLDTVDFIGESSWGNTDRSRYRRV
jgi:hypothetical protein